MGSKIKSGQANRKHVLLSRVTSHEWEEEEEEEEEEDEEEEKMQIMNWEKMMDGENEKRREKEER